MTIIDNPKIDFQPFFTKYFDNLKDLGRTTKRNFQYSGITDNQISTMMTKSKSILVVLVLVCTGQLMAQKVIPLWSGEIPNQRTTDEKEILEGEDLQWIRNVQIPTLEIYLPTKRQATGRAVIICPGGGYLGLAYDWEGVDIAKWCNTKGIAAFVLKYRLPSSKSLVVPHQAPLMDAQRAVRMVRKYADNWGVDQNNIGIMGFSAGGHLASTLATQYDTEQKDYDELDAISARPDFAILVYPVITMADEYTHMGSRTNLIGATPSDAMKAHYSNELQVDKNTPPTFLIHSSDDGTVPVMNSILFYQALQKNNIYSEMHIYPEGGHGYSLALGKKYLDTWTERLSDWLRYL